MDKKEAMVTQIQRARRRSSRCLRLSRLCDEKVTGMIRKLGEIEYGPIGSKISFRQRNGSVCQGKISYFEYSNFDTIPVCIIDTESSGSTVPTFISSGEDIVRDGRSHSAG